MGWILTIYSHSSILEMSSWDSQCLTRPSSHTKVTQKKSPSSFWIDVLEEVTKQTPNNFLCLNSIVITYKSNIKAVFFITPSRFVFKTCWKRGLHKPHIVLCAWTRPSSHARVTSKESSSSLRKYITPIIQCSKCSPSGMLL